VDGARDSDTRHTGISYERSVGTIKDTKINKRYQNLNKMEGVRLLRGSRLESVIGRKRVRKGRRARLKGKGKKNPIAASRLVLAIGGDELCCRRGAGGDSERDGQEEFTPRTRASVFA
jgi:hypothetical protein